LLHEEEVLLLREVDAGSGLQNLLHADEIDMKAVLRAALQTDDARLHALPDLLVMKLPQMVGDYSDEVNREWIDDESGACSTNWGDTELDLSSCCADCIAEPRAATYRLRAQVVYCNKGDVPSHVVSSEGHFVAYFQEAGQWYFCDDLSRDAKCQKLSSPPTAFPFLCFFENVNRLDEAWPEMMPNLVKELSTGGSGDEEGDGDEEGPSEEDDSDDVPDESEPGAEAPEPKRRRLRGKQFVRSEERFKGKAKGKAKLEGKAKAKAKAKRQQDRTGRKQDRTGRKQKQDRTERKQVQDRMERKQQEIREKRIGGPANDNTDASRRDEQSNQCNPVEQYRQQRDALQSAASNRAHAGNVLLLLSLLQPLLKCRDLIQQYSLFYVYGGDDCLQK